MRIILIGQAAFAERVLDGLRAADHEVVATYSPPDQPGAKAQARTEAGRPQGRRRRRGADSERRGWGKLAE